MKTRKSIAWTAPEKILLIAFLAVILFSVNGCSIISHGRLNKITPGQVSTVKVGETTKEDVIKALGEPQSVIYKPNNMEVFVYVHGVERSIGIPFFITWGRAGGTGQVLSISFDRYGVVADYEYKTDEREMIQ